MTAPTMQGKTVLITGATNGIGEAAALELAQMGAQVVIVGRNPARAETVVSEIREKTGNPQVDILLADLSSMEEVRRLAQDFKQKYARLDVLVNNAGATFSKRQVTVDGLEATFALNHLSYFLLTSLLLDMLTASAPSRIVSVASDAQQMNVLDFDDLQGERKYNMMGFRAYAQSKLMNIMFTYELSRRLEGTGVTANVLHPGFVATGFGTNNGGVMRLGMHLAHWFALTPKQGADTVVYLASSPEVQSVTGKYFERRKQIKSVPISYDTAAQQRLWQISEQLAGLTVTV